MPAISRPALLLVLLALASPAARSEDAPVWNRGRAKAVEDLAERWWRARPPTRFVAWDPEVRAKLRDEAIALGPIPEGKREDVLEAIWKPVRKLGPHHDRGNSISTPYGEATFLLSGAGRNKGLILGLHGGGAGAGSASEAAGKWKMQGCMGIYPQAIRLVDDAWNTVHGERFLLTLIEIAKAQYQIDPDRVFVAGFSMGGTGSWFLAGRHPDLLAGALPYHGVLMATPRSQVATKEEVGAVQPGLVPNVRNLPMWYTTGLEDRNCMPGTYLFVADMLRGLREKDPEGYGRIHFEAVEGVAHAFPPGEPGRGFAYLKDEVRDARPATLVWESCNRRLHPMPGEEDRELGCTRLEKRWFSWIRCDEPRDEQTIRAVRRGNEIELTTSRTRGLSGITIYLDGEMIDPEKEVVVRADGAEVYRGRPVPEVWTVLESLDARVDRSLVFDRKIELGGR